MVEIGPFAELEPKDGAFACPSPALAEPYPFRTKLTLHPGGRHELLDAVVFGRDSTGSGWRYRCLFPYTDADDRPRLSIAKVYSNEIAATNGVATDELVCQGCPQLRDNVCAQGTVPEACA